MAPRKLYVPKDTLQDVIDAAEQENGGPFLNRMALYEAVAASDWAKSFQPPLTYPIIYLRVKEFDIICKTPIGGKKRRGKDAVHPKIAVEDKVLCALSEWHSYIVEVGIQVGATVCRRVVVSADRLNWIIRYQKKNMTLSQHAVYFPCFRQLLNCVANWEVDPIHAATVIITRFREIFPGKTIDFNAQEHLSVIGKRIDDTFQVSMHRHENTFGRVFRDDPEIVPKQDTPLKRQMTAEQIIAQHDQFV